MWRRPTWRLLSSDGSCRSTALVIRALGMIVGKLVRDEGGIGGVSAVSGVSGVSAVSGERKFILTEWITQAAQTLIEAFEIDISPDLVTTRRVGRVLTKMRFTSRRHAGRGKRGWMISLDQVIRWAVSYGLNPAEITGIDQLALSTNGVNGANGVNGVNVTPTPSTPHEGIL